MLLSSGIWFGVPDPGELDSGSSCVCRECVSVYK